MIPKKVHLTWKTKDIFNSDSVLIQNGIKNMKDINPDWDIIIYDDNDVEKYLKDKMGDRGYQLIENQHIVVKSDIWRLIKLYEEGGIYTDIDRYFNIPFSEVIDEDTAWVIPTYYDQDFSHDIMISGPGNPVFQSTFELIMRRRSIGHDNVYFLGPQTYMHGITQTLFNEIIDSNPGVEIFQNIRNEINKNPSYKCIREEPPLNTVFYQHKGADELIDWEKHKRNLYKTFDLKHWTGEW